ncbi:MULTISPECIES: GNAT family N-acetyltransferase [Vibrio]|uniref:GNAT family N-acetyltransferase n=1 Tax=Vibrio TaxID=662 RepID=UPI00058775F9|nr:MULTISPECIES: GNAT family protein [Vibrio]MCM5509480.1 GNAT family N-acetyltransferase [Vibrio sp. SCSIO 43169]MDE3899607.1 GNAT family N-acetyltransferase [Vibrio sp. CC007]QFT34982.1 Spermidine N(1)-acetyltransferase [Vibrio sp. THAF64]QGM32881.1 Spermidine N(1)-acetyltransferase [Vibrio sp. THAF191d]QGN68383.1 Spermidine N(1)-acetyltransferase [Vibrio sp. THAF191c]
MIIGKRIKLEELNADMVSDTYVAWLNDPKVNKYLESRYVSHTMETCKDFVQSVQDDENSVMFAIFELESGTHIGNVKLAEINRRYKRAEIGILIGDQNVWGRGYAREAIQLLEEYAKSQLSLRRITAGCYDCNERSVSLFESMGYKREGVFVEHFIFEGRYVDSIRMGKLI